MAAYLIVEMDVTDAEGYTAYGRAVMPVLQQYGARVLAASNEVESLEGEWAPKRVVLVEFESVDQAQKWYHSAEYRGPKAMRLRATSSRAVLLPGR